MVGTRAARLKALSSPDEPKKPEMTDSRASPMIRLAMLPSPRIPAEPRQARLGKRLALGGIEGHAEVSESGI